MQARVATADHDGVVAVARPEGAPSLAPRVSWGAVFAGGVAAVGLGAMLNMLGLAIGATTLDPATPGESPAAETFALIAGGWLLLANLVALLGGGWVAARLSGTADRMDGALHGFAVWAVAFLLSFLLVGNIVAGTAGTAARGASALIGGTAQGLGQAAQAIAPQAADALDPEGLTARLERMLRSEGAPEEMSSDQRQAEIARLIAERVREEGDGAGQDRLPALLAAEFGIPEQQAQARIAELESRARELATEVERQARSAAEAATNAAATGAYWVFAAMILGAAAAAVGGAIGTRRLVVACPGQM
ncbi:hypothetical protein DFH01_21850 [Falsiroseomonas bella]|uniref:PhnA-like protein n=1 Tax=Falsiroseomonas bella TaxID=2184016 RepID=A0A317F723_9PROT|nr:hypothetical protein [Falsiroseomonas bella]PWS34980.1 hypothetical protein DFH01_21850 [Falsiroseomonas bella]